MPRLEPPTPLPLPLIACLLYNPEDDGPPTSSAQQLINDLGAYAGRPARTCGYLGMTLFVYHYTTPGMERCATLQPGWLGWILARNLAIMLIFLTFQMLNVCPTVYMRAIFFTLHMLIVLSYHQFNFVRMLTICS